MEFYEHRHAAASLAAMNGRKIMGKVSYRVYRVSGNKWASVLPAVYLIFKMRKDDDNVYSSVKTSSNPHCSVLS